MAASPFSHPDYPSDIEELLRMHPIALYRRLTESAMERRYNAEEVKAWKSCMDKWAEEFGGKERKKVGSFLSLPFAPSLFLLFLFLTGGYGMA